MSRMGGTAGEQGPPGTGEYGDKAEQYPLDLRDEHTNVRTGVESQEGTGFDPRTGQVKVAAQAPTATQHLERQLSGLKDAAFVGGPDSAGPAQQPELDLELDNEGDFPRLQPSQQQQQKE